MPLTHVALVAAGALITLASSLVLGHRIWLIARANVSWLEAWPASLGASAGLGAGLLTVLSWLPAR